MTGPYSNDLRDRTVAAVRSGGSRRSVAELFGVSTSSMVRWVQRFARRAVEFRLRKYADTFFGSR